MTPTWRNCSHVIAASGVAADRRPKTPRFQTASPAAKYANTRFLGLRRSGERAQPRRRRFRPRETRGRSLWRFIRPQPHAGKAVVHERRPDVRHDDGEDEDVPPAAVVRARLTEPTFLREAVALQRVDAEHVVGEGLG